MMVVPSNIDLSNLAPHLREFLNGVIGDLEDDGYFFIEKIQKFKDRDIAIGYIRGKDPLLSNIRKFKIDTRLLYYIDRIVNGRMSYNFTVKNGRLFVPKDVISEKFDMTSTPDSAEVSNSKVYTPKTPVEILWSLAKDGFYYISDGEQLVPCHKTYFGEDNFNIYMQNVLADGKMSKHPIMTMDNGSYLYGEVWVTKTSRIADLTLLKSIIGDSEQKIMHDNMGREFTAHKLDLRQYEKNMLNVIKFGKIYDRDYTFAVLDITYNMCSYLNGLSLALHDIDKNCKYPMCFLPFKANRSFTVSANKQNNFFTFQHTGYSADIIHDVSEVYRDNQAGMKEYLKSKDESKREELYKIFDEMCGDRYGKLLHYFVSGLFDGLAIQKGDKATRISILTDYIDTVYAEFFMYGCYFYDLRTAFLRNNFRISKEYSNTIFMNSYNGEFFLIG